MIKVSALVSTYNSMEFIEGCLTDLTAQTLFRRGLLEIIVVDSASPADERSVVERFQNRFENIRYHRSTERETLYGAWNTAIDLACGEYLTNANTDDRHRPDGIERHLAALEFAQGADLAYADVLRCTVPNQTFAEQKGAECYRYKPFFAPDVLLHYQFGCQPVWRRRLHEKIGLFDKQLRAAGDHEFNYRFNLAGLRAVHIAEPLGSFLERATAISTQDNTSVREQGELRKRYFSTESIFRLFAAEGWDTSTPAARVRALNELGCRAAELELPWHPGMQFSDAAAAAECFLKGLELQPGDPALLNNLGVTLARLGRGDDARRCFEGIARCNEFPVISDNGAAIQQGSAEAGALRLIRYLG